MRPHKSPRTGIPWNLKCSRKLVLVLCRDATFLRMYVCMRYPCHIYGRGMRIADECQVPTLPCTCMNENWRRERDNNSTQTQQYTTTTGLRPDCDCLVARASKPIMYACGLCGGGWVVCGGVFVSILPDTSGTYLCIFFIAYCK
jgi:hypothetical protein